MYFAFQSFDLGCTLLYLIQVIPEPRRVQYFWPSHVSINRLAMFGYTPQRAKRHWNAHSYDSFIRQVKGDKYLLTNQPAVHTSGQCPVGRSDKHHINEHWVDLMGDGCPVRYLKTWSASSTRCWNNDSLWYEVWFIVSVSQIGVPLKCRLYRTNNIFTHTLAWSNRDLKSKFQLVSLEQQALHY
jgi:hypothetical protein